MVHAIKMVVLVLQLLSHSLVMVIVAVYDDCYMLTHPSILILVVTWIISIPPISVMFTLVTCLFPMVPTILVSYMLLLWLSTLLVMLLTVVNTIWITVHMTLSLQRIRSIALVHYLKVM